MPIFEQRFDSSLGRWTHTGWVPAPDHPLEWAVVRVWDFYGMAAYPQERVFPSGTVELIVQLDDRYLDVTSAGTVPTPASCVTGIFSRAAVVQAPPRPCRVLGVRLRPAGAWPLLGHPLSQLTELTADLGDLLGRAGGELAERCHDAVSGMERVRRAVEWIGRQLSRPGAPGVDPSARWVADRIARGGGIEPIAGLRAQTGLTDARLISLFRQQVGVTPKRLARIHRFDRTLGLLTRGRGSLARIAEHAGYFDQPHMNAEFRRMAGLTPGEFLAATRYPNSLSLPEPS